MAPIIELRNVYKRFGDNVIYEDMSFARRGRRDVY